MPAELRPLVPEDADEVLELSYVTFGELEERMGVPVTPRPADLAPGLRRIAHLAQTDPGGAWVATGPGGRIDGAALALVREGVWGLSLLIVRPGRQSNGTGSALLRAALRHGEGTRAGIILASEDARALRAYARAGFALRPVMDAAGEVTNPPPAPAAVRPIRWPQDREIVDTASRFVRGATHAHDVPVYLECGMEVLVHDGGGWACADAGKVRCVAATSEAVAADLLRAVLAGTPRATVEFIAAGNDWAFGVALEAGLALRPSGAVMTRGEVGPMAPYIPSGAYL
jgi:GNAT superfamily N-acetyltransferase